MRHFEKWLSEERLLKAQEKAESQDLEEAAQAQVGRPRERWCIGSGESEENTGKCCTNRTKCRFPTGDALHDAPVKRSRDGMSM